MSSKVKSPKANGVNGKASTPNRDMPRWLVAFVPVRVTKGVPRETSEFVVYAPSEELARAQARKAILLLSNVLDIEITGVKRSGRWCSKLNMTVETEEEIITDDRRSHGDGLA